VNIAHVYRSIVSTIYRKMQSASEIIINRNESGEEKRIPVNLEKVILN